MMIKKIILLVGFSTLILSIPFSYRWAVCGFRVGKLMFDSEAGPHSPIHDVSAEMQFVLAHPFVYFSHGAQSFVFESEDGRYILKILRRSIRPHPWRNHLRNWVLDREKKLNPNKRDERLLRACALAYERAQDLTGMVALHLTGTDTVLPQALLKDPIGRSHWVDLNRCFFVLQRKARSVRDVFMEAIRDHNRERFLHLIRQFISLLKSRTDRKLANSDTKVGSNFGFLEHQAIEWDFGNYWIDEKLEETDHRLREIGVFAEHLQAYLKRMTPDWAGYVKEIFEDEMLPNQR